MRYLCLALALCACGKRDTAPDAKIVVNDTAIPPAAPAAPAMSPLPDRLVGTWTAQGYDAGSKRPQQFTITWTRAPDGSLVGTIAFHPGETYKVNVVSTGDSTIVYESAPHRSPTLKGQVVTRTEARLAGDSLIGTYEARGTKGGKVLRGRFAAKRGS
jgi:hypothetical protein